MVVVMYQGQTVTSQSSVRVRQLPRGQDPTIASGVRSVCDLKVIDLSHTFRISKWIAYPFDAYISIRTSFAVPYTILLHHIILTIN